MKAVTGAVFPRVGDVSVFRTLLTIGTSTVKSANSILRSETSALNVRMTYLPSLSTAILLHGVYGSAKWCGIFSPRVTKRRVSFWKCVGPSDVSPVGTVNAAHQSIMALVAFSGEVLGNIKTQL